MGAELLHLVLYEFFSCSVTQNSIRIGLVRSAIKILPSIYNGHYSAHWGVIPTDFLFFLSPYNGHFFSVCPPIREDFNKKHALGFSGNESALEIRV